MIPRRYGGVDVAEVKTSKGTETMTEFQFPHLNQGIRDLMVEELALDVRQDQVYVGKRLNQMGIATYTSALQTAMESGTLAEFQASMEPVPGRLWVSATTARNGRRSTTPVTSARTLTEGEFNRYYMRAICRDSIHRGDGKVLVVRAKEVANPRADYLVTVSVGDVLAADVVLRDLRAHPGESTVTGIPRGPNSGLSLGPL